MLKRIWDQRTVSNFRKRLLDWYQLHRRKLPWREDVNPYKVWVSEIMLQQTQAKSVIPYYRRFLDRYPDLESLARSTEPEVLSYWSGLGYYSRARNLLRAAERMIERYGSFPRDFHTILSLPGIGRYTAGAICSIAFDQPYPVVDGNIRRVLTRLTGIQNRVADGCFWDLMSALVPQSNASNFNQAMMELGALVCTPLQPKCPDCPAQVLCKARSLGLEASIPPVRNRKTCNKISIILLVLEQNRSLMLMASGKRDLIPGVWGLPWRTLISGHSAEETAAEMCREIVGYVPELEPRDTVRHSISNNRITGMVFFGRVDPALATGNAVIPSAGTRSRRAKPFIEKLRYKNGFAWVRRTFADSLLTSSLYKKALAQTGSHRTNNKNNRTVP